MVKNKKTSFFIIMIIALCISFLSVGFSAFQNNLSIDDTTATVRIDKDVRVTGVRVDSSSNASSSYEEYNVSNIQSAINLLNKDSYIIYEVDICNLGNVPIGISSATIDNNNLKFEFLDYNMKAKICENDQCTLGVKKKIKIKVSYNDNATINDNSEKFIINFKFGRIYNIDYVDIQNESILPKEVIEGDTLNLNIINNINGNLLVYMNNRKLSKNDEYQYLNELLTIPNINGNLSIRLNKYICKRATKLHTEVCTYNKSAGCGVIYSKGSSITYGNIGTTGILTTGDAFDCDVNGDGVYDQDTERFYYISDYYNTKTKTFEDDTAVLIYYNNVNAGVPDIDKRYIYDKSVNNNGPTEAIKGLPTISQWPNVKLKNNMRSIVSDNNENQTAAGQLPTNFDYSGYSARLLTLQELRKGIGRDDIPTMINGELKDAVYLLENTYFSHINTPIYAWWLETPRAENDNQAWGPHSTHIALHDLKVANSVPYAVRPAIDVSKENIEY